MSVDANTVRKIPRLAWTGINEAQVAPPVDELSTILGWIQQLGKVDTTGLAPMTAVIANQPTWRADAITDGDVQAKVVANAPDATSGFFAVPKVIE